MCFVYKSQNKLFFLKNEKCCRYFCVWETIVEIMMMICFNQKHVFGNILFTVSQQPKINGFGVQSRTKLQGTAKTSTARKSGEPRERERERERERYST